MIPLSLSQHPNLGILDALILYSVGLALCLLGIIAYKILQNSRDALFWILNLCIYSILAALYSYWIKDNFDYILTYLGIVFPFIILIVPTLFIRKNGESAWSLLKKAKGGIKQDKIQMGIIVFEILWVGIALLKKH